VRLSISGYKLLLGSGLLLPFSVPMARRGVWLTGGLLAVGLGLFVLRPGRPGGPDGPATNPPPAVERQPQAQPAEPQPGEPKAPGPPPAPTDEIRSHAFRLPSGRAPALGCAAARAIVAQARAQLSHTPDPVDPRALADATADWLDPYGLWSVAPDSPVTVAFDRRASEVVADLEGRGGADCAGARALGTALVAWVRELRGVFEEAREHDSAGEDVAEAESAPAFEGAMVTRPARDLAALLGRRIGAVEAQLGAAGPSYVDAASSRYFPDLDPEGWAGVVLAAAVRAYVPAIDPHGAWAPLDEESSVYEVDLEAHPPARLWEKAERTAIGLRIESGAAPPLADGDVVLSLAGLPTAGMSYEQTEQLAFAAADARPPAEAVVVHAGELTPVTTSLDGNAQGGSVAGGPDDGDLPVERVEFGEGDAVVVAIHDIRDDLGDALTRAILHERERGARPLAGVVLDLRGNGGGSTDGAIDALGIFIPGAPLFPMRRRDGSLETDRAPEPPGVDRWRGPVAALVDGETASAAEMVAGALVAYRRGPTIGTNTFGKGCAQEYVDDEADAGVLRLTTLVYALPDGTPVQRVGLTPTIRFPFLLAMPADRESALPHAPPTWRGPDVRPHSMLAHAEDGTWSSPWPVHTGNVGPCKDADLCRALRLLGASPATARRKSFAKGR
jgi:carboxyl-terminal processing protease